MVKEEIQGAVCAVSLMSLAGLIR